MNIKEAKQQIKNAIIAYATTDSHGRPLIPVSKQRPVFLVGAPGIGKTAIMEQIAKELDIAFVSYSMTHHTRQSALGLPYIIEKNYGGKDYKVSEYTMSEIIASVYDAMEKTKKKQGILFLDEINCISETLAPSMLQFLQYKTFGRHQVPDGWIVVTAGNPPEYNRSVKEFDIVTWDRLKKIEVEPDYEAWKEYALNTHVHPVVTSYLDIKTNHFYSISTTVDGKSFVTARGWDDLSQMIILYEQNNLVVDENLIGQYLQDEKIARDFSHYYQLFHKYKADYQVDSILEGSSTEQIKQRAQKAKFDERLSLISLVMSSLEDVISQTVDFEVALKMVLNEIKAMKAKAQTKEHYVNAIEKAVDLLKQKIYQEEVSRKPEWDLALELLQRILSNLNTTSDDENFTKNIQDSLQMMMTQFKQANQKSQDALSNTFAFFEEVFSEGQEMLILVTEMTIHKKISQYIYAHGCEKYFEHNKQLLFEDKQNELLEKIEAIDLLSLAS